MIATSVSFELLIVHLQEPSLRNALPRRAYCDYWMANQQVRCCGAATPVT
jgi:hypothetical protein